MSLEKFLQHILYRRRIASLVHLLVHLLYHLYLACDTSSATRLFLD